MIQSPSRSSHSSGLHVAIIMDGNGRWATERGLPRMAGHQAGSAAVRRVLEAAPRLGIDPLTLYAFSSDNWERPPHEVAALMQTFDEFLCAEKAKCGENGIRISVIGRRDRLPLPLREAMEGTELATARGRRMHLRLAIDYSGREAIVQAARRFNGWPEPRKEFSRLLAEVTCAVEPAPDVDLLIRTGGEQRLSDLPLWEIAYAELLFIPRMWPDFDAADLETAIKEFRARDRRFGRLPEAPEAEAVLPNNSGHAAERDSSRSLP
ncbi:MAG TPA: polyprenyl diphosphate synthase [Terriglobia bacterium]|nr:polyprenyl diphosphate synthase [Terriglobia bacterium]